MPSACVVVSISHPSPDPSPEDGFGPQGDRRSVGARHGVPVRRGGFTPPWRGKLAATDASCRAERRSASGRWLFAPTAPPAAWSACAGLKAGATEGSAFSETLRQSSVPIKRIGTQGKERFLHPFLPRHFRRPRDPQPGQPQSRRREADLASSESALRKDSLRGHQVSRKPVFAWMRGVRARRATSKCPAVAFSYLRLLVAHHIIN